MLGKDLFDLPTRFGSHESSPGDRFASIQYSVRKINTEITGPVKAPTGSFTKRIGDKLLCCRLRALQITTSEAGSSDVQFPRHTYGHRLLPAVQDIKLRIGDGASDWDRASLMPAQWYLVDATANHGFSGAVLIH